MPQSGAESEVVTVREVLLVAHTHHDVGYTNSPRLIDRQHREIVAEVLRLAGKGPADGPDAFRWSFEVARPVLGYLRTAPPDRVRDVRELATAGRVAVTGGYLNMTTLPSAAELDTTYDRLAVVRAAGIPVRTEQHGDVNGIAWGTVEAMRRAGLTRLVMALNPDHGRPPFRQPTGFWWAGASGMRVFVWLSTHYGVGEQWGIVDGDVDLAQERIAQFVAELDARADYPYDVAVVHAANDNRWPTARYLDVVRAWNAMNRIPMRTATIDQAVDVLQRQAERTRVPVVRGEWSDWWAHGHGSTAREVAVYRKARSFALAAQTSLGLTVLRGDGRPALAEVLGYRRAPARLRDEDEVVADLERADDELLLFAEHTWGSWETYSKPHSTFSHSSVNAQAGFAYGAYDLARDLAVEGMHRLVASGPERPATGAEPVVVALNLTESDRREPVEVEVDGIRHARVVVSAPAFGIGTAPVPPPARRRSGRGLELGCYRAVVDPHRGGVVSLVDLRSGRELVGGAPGYGLGAVVAEQIAPGSVHPLLREPKRFRPEDPGPDFVHRPSSGAQEPELCESDGLTQLRWQGSAPGVPSVITTLTLYADLDVVDLDVELVKPARLAPESVFVAFPFAVRSPRFLLETAGAVFAADTEQLPDTSRDWYSIQHAVGVTNDEHGVVWGSMDAPLVQVGGFFTGRWARRLRVQGGHVNSWLMNNLHFTNFQAQQDGAGRYRYRFAASPSPVTAAQVRRAGRDLLEPLQARCYAGPLPADRRTGLRVEPAGSVLAEVRPLGGGEVRVRLRNITSEPVTARVSWDGPGASSRHTAALSAYDVGDVVLRRKPLR